MLLLRSVQIQRGLIELRVINRTSLSQHRALSGNIKLPWQSESLEGSVEVRLSTKDLKTGIPFRASVFTVRQTFSNVTSSTTDPVSRCFGRAFMSALSNQLLQLKDWKQGNWLVWICSKLTD